MCASIDAGIVARTARTDEQGQPYPDNQNSEPHITLRASLRLALGRRPGRTTCPILGETGEAHIAAQMGGWYGAWMALGDCYFETDRLVVDDWSHILTGDAAEALRDSFVVSLMTEAVTRDLPPGWQGPFDMARAASWFAERQREGTVLLVVNRSGRRPVGLVFLSESNISDRGLDIRLGYIIAEGVWGRGLGTEVVAGIADWCRTAGTIRSVVGGVADRNNASARVLQKNGFIPHNNGLDPSVDEVEYTLLFP